MSARCQDNNLKNIYGRSIKINVDVFKIKTKIGASNDKRPNAIYSYKDAEFRQKYLGGITPNASDKRIAKENHIYHEIYTSNFTECCT